MISEAFTIGDRVRYSNRGLEVFSNDYDFRNDVGTVMSLGADVGVRWDSPRNCYHRLGGLCENKHGFWLPYSYLTHAPEECDVELSEDDWQEVFQ